MKLIKVGIFIICLSYLLAGCWVKDSHKQTAPYLLVVSLDGFRWDYQDLYETPCFDSIEQIGVKAASLQPSFPSKTFPNHYTIATGLYPDHHGLVSNSFYSKTHQNVYKVADRDKVQDGSYYGGEPIWVTAEKQGIKSASYFWVGSEADVKGIRPSIWKEYDGKVSYSSRIDSVITWFQMPYGKRPHLTMLYFDEPDYTGHHYGPETDSTRIKINSIDAYIAELCNGIKTLDIKDSINIIILSDHGMGAISNAKRNNINQMIDTCKVNHIWGSNPFYMIDADEEHIGEIKTQINKHQGVKAWERGEIPDYLHFGTHQNIASLVVVADSAWSIVDDASDKIGGGTHGYDPTNKDMHGIFYAFGPSFKRGYRAATFENIQVYELMCFLLGLEPAPNDGYLNQTLKLLR